MHTAAAPYQLKAGAYSSHTLLLSALPADGSGRTLLDVGCADGYLSEILAKRGYAVTGIDLPRADPGRFPSSVRFLPADLDAGLPPLEERFDFVVCADVLEHLRRPAAMLEQLRDRLKPSGRIVASLPNSGHAYFRWNVLRGRFPREDRGLFDRTHVQFYMWSGWVELFISAGLSIDSLRSSGVPVGLALPRWQDTAVVRLMERLSYESARWWKTMFAYQFIVTAHPERRA
jgi:SAM-dependent methyltransferase